MNKCVRLNLVILLVGCFIICNCSISLKGQSLNDQPKLVVGIVVDQMRNEYLQRFYDDFGEDGFKRLLNDGFYFSNMHYNYIPTYTAPGHATIYTGAYPNTHGIVGNYWYHKAEKKDVYCTADENYPLVGGEGKGMSPFRLKTTNLADELKLSTNFRGKVMAVSIKDRGAILAAGHFGEQAFWFNDAGHFISSKFYMEELPNWAAAFNAENKALDYIKKGWQKTDGISFDESLPDDNAYESLLGGKAKPVFPYDLTSFIKRGGVGSIRTTPFGNDLVVDFTLEGLVQEELGKDDFVDLLSVSFSSTDYVGHSMGTRAVEIQDTYIRLDKSIAQLLKALDDQVGEGNYVVFLTADHGAAEVPKFMHDHQFDVEAISNANLIDTLRRFSIAKYGENVFKNFSNFNIHFNENVILNKKLNRQVVESDVVTELLKYKFVKRVYTQRQIINFSSGDHMGTQIYNGYDVKQCGDLVVILEPGYIPYKQTGTTHGSGYTYDTHVPMILYGWHVPTGRSYERCNVVQIAPTLAQLINISLPNGTESQILEPLFNGDNN